MFGNGNPWQQPEPEQARMILLPSGALMDEGWLREQQARGAAQERSLAAQRQAREEAARVEIEQAERERRIRQESERRLLPPHLRDILP